MLPLIFVCENNLYGISTHTSQSTAVEDISVRAVAYDMPGETVDGNDVLSIDKAIVKAIERARSGGGPSLIECKTYRWQGHWTGDPQVYRTREEVKSWMEKCPIKRFEEYMVSKKIATEDELKKIEEEVIVQMDAAEKFALESPEPDPATVMDNVFCY